MRIPRIPLPAPMTMAAAPRSLLNVRVCSANTNSLPPIIFLTVAGEEQGLNGSTHFAKMAKEQGWQLEGVLNNDIVGGNRTPGDTAPEQQLGARFF